MMVVSCSTVEISNNELCTELEDGSAACANTLSDDTREVPKEGWALERVGEVCMKVDDYSKVKSEREKLCKLSGACRYAK